MSLICREVTRSSDDKGSPHHPHPLPLSWLPPLSCWRPNSKPCAPHRQQRRHVRLTQRSTMVKKLQISIYNNIQLKQETAKYRYIYIKISQNSKYTFKIFSFRLFADGWCPHIFAEGWCHPHFLRINKTLSAKMLLMDTNPLLLLSLSYA